MFLNAIHEQLLHQGFQSLSLTQSGLFGFIKKRETTNYCVFFINLPSELPENVWTIRLSERQLIEQFGKDGNTQYLFVYVTDQPEKVSCLCKDNYEGHWVVDTENEVLLIYENQVTNFCGVRDAIESVLIGLESSKKYIPFATIGLITINVIVFLFMEFFCNTSFRDFLIDKGGVFWPAITRHHEIYRFITSMFIHLGFDHITNNMILLLLMGCYTEEYIGHTKFGILYFVSGILAGVVSMGYNMINNNFILSAGASGAIFGVVGALAALVFFSKDFRRDISGWRLAVFLGISILSGLLIWDI